MKALISITSVAILALMEAANAQGAAPKQLFFEGDLVRGAQQGAPGPFCQLTYADYHPGEDLPRFRFAFEVTPPMVQ